LFAGTGALCPGAPGAGVLLSGFVGAPFCGDAAPCAPALTATQLTAAKTANPNRDTRKLTLPPQSHAPQVYAKPIPIAVILFAASQSRHPQQTVILSEASQNRHPQPTVILSEASHREAQSKDPCILFGSPPCFDRTSSGGPFIAQPIAR
jgi:hypothetical protein